jgi:HKD family nuclease
MNKNDRYLPAQETRNFLYANREYNWMVQNKDDRNIAKHTQHTHNENYNNATV